MFFPRSLKYLFLVSCFLSLVSCRPSGIKETIERADVYEQKFKTDAAWIVLEWNGQPFGYGSGFLIDRGKGAFFTNKHVSDMFNSLGKGSHKVLFGGRSYNVRIVMTPILTDAALIRITDDFNPGDFPEPAPINEESPKIGDPVVIEGFHIHPANIRKLDEASGYKFPVLPVFRDYYKMDMSDPDKEREMIFEKLEGRVTKLDSTVDELMERCNINKNSGNYIDRLKNSTNLYVEVKTSRDHRFSFGGLSGSFVKNLKGEILGITTLQDPCRVDWLHLGEDGVAVGKEVYDTVYFTPIKYVTGLKQYLN